MISNRGGIMRRLWLLALGLIAALTIAGCGGGGEASPAGEVPTAELPSTEPPEAPPSSEPSPPATEPPSEEPSPEEPAPSEDSFAFEVWLARGESLFVVHRTAPKTPRVATTAIESLLEGPGAVEAAAGVTSAVPTDTALLGITVEDGLATVDLSSEFESGGGTLSMTMRLAQVVYTLTQFPTVENVAFELDGQPVEVFSGEGIVLEDPVDRDDYEDVRPVILVSAPGIGDRIESPARISGVANVFEANVTVEILDAQGNVLAHDFTTATCGTGCFGDYELELPFEVSEEEPGTIVVHDDDAAGTGTPPHVVEIPVTLAP
jgi:spore germination protein GerM